MFEHLSKVYGAGVYRPSLSEIRVWFDILNETIFDSGVPKFRWIEIKHYTGQVAACVPHEANTGRRSCKLEINPRFRNFHTFLCALAHEMVHANEWMVDKKEGMSHGPDFYKWKEKIDTCGLSLTVGLYNRGGSKKIT